LEETSTPPSLIVVAIVPESSTAAETTVQVAAETTRRGKVVATLLKHKASPTTTTKPYKRTRRGRYPPITNLDYSWVGRKMDAYLSKCSTRHMRKFMNHYDICIEDLDNYISVVGYKRSKRVYRKSPLNAKDFTYVYKYFFIFSLLFFRLTC